MLFQVFINALIVGSVYALVACGFVLTYVVTRFANFGHGAQNKFSEIFPIYI